MGQEIIDISNWDRVSPITIKYEINETYAIGSRGVSRIIQNLTFNRITVGDEIVFESSMGTDLINGPTTSSECRNCFKQVIVTATINKTFSGLELDPFKLANQIIIQSGGTVQGFSNSSNRPRIPVNPELQNLEVLFETTDLSLNLTPQIFFTNAQFEDSIGEIFSERKLVYQYLFDGSLLDVSAPLILKITIFDENFTITKTRDILVESNESFDWVDEIKDIQFINMIDPKVKFEIFLYGDIVDFTELTPLIIAAPTDQSEGLSTNQKIGIIAGLATAIGVGFAAIKMRN